MSFIYVNIFSVFMSICSVHGNGVTDIQLDQSSISTKTSASEWLV